MIAINRIRGPHSGALAEEEKDLHVKAGPADAYEAFALTFRGSSQRFWQRMTTTGIALGGLVLASEPELRRTRIRGRDVALGVGAAVGLYGIFQAEDRLARRAMPKGAEEIGSIYSLRGLRPEAEVAPDWPWSSLPRRSCSGGASCSDGWLIESGFGGAPLSGRPLTEARTR